MTRKVMHFLNPKKTCEFTHERSVLEVALKQGIDLGHSCGGMGSCTTCRVIVKGHASEALPPRNELEQDIADMRQFLPEERLSCQLPPIDGLTVEIPPTVL